mgnify:CR=1 FL=1|tara:strand:+ start:1679 stop:2158 length:480 start_codon:yes stop_codon:yes gene_type:complete
MATLINADTSDGLKLTSDTSGEIQLQSAGTTAVTIDSSSNLKFNSGYGSVATAYGCRAWVNFNGTGTVAIRDSGNVSSITDNGTGDYTVNFTTAMPDANYAVNATGKWGSGNEGEVTVYNDTTTISTTAVRILNGVPGTAGASAITPRDSTYLFVNILR